MKSKLRFLLNRLVASIMAAALFLPTSAHAQTYKWVTDRISKLETVTGGWAWVYLKGGKIDCSDVGGPTGQHDLHIRSLDPITFDQAAFDQLYSTLLTAVAANMEVEFHVTGVSAFGSQWCVIERVRIVAN